MSYGIKISDLTMSYGETQVLKGINLDVLPGTVLAIIGASGSGKSTLLRMLIGLISPTSGKIMIGENEVGSYTESEWNGLRKYMGMVFQYSALFDSLSVKDNVAFGLKQHTTKSDHDIDVIVDNMLDLVGLKDYGSYMPNELSGGMKKRVSFARAIAVSPRILLYDEPTAGLDPVMSDVINNVMLDIKNKLRVTSVLVTHDMYSAFLVADKIAMIHEGVIIEEGTPSEILKSEDPVVRKFIDKAIPLEGYFNEK